MQAVSVSRDLRDKFERLVRDGHAAFVLEGNAPKRDVQAKLGHLQAAIVAYAQAWTVADVACTLAPSSQYAAWSDRRLQVGRTLQATRAMADALVAEVAGAEKCCFDGCPKPATQQFGNGVYFPMCDEHATKV